MAKNPLVRVTTPEEVTEAIAADAAASQPTVPEAAVSQLAGHVRNRLQQMRTYRETEGINKRLLEGLRAFKGEYSPEKLALIRQFQGSEVYARLTSTKCKAATALLRDIYLGPERPWAIEPTPVPTLPDDIKDSVAELTLAEVGVARQAGEPIPEEQVRDRLLTLTEAASTAQREAARKEALKATRELDDVLVEGGFYEALAELLVDLPIFPYAVLKGPIVERQYKIKWVEGVLAREPTDVLTYHRVSPFDFYWMPNARTIGAADVVERMEMTRADLIDSKELPNFDAEAIDRILERYQLNGSYRWWDPSDFERQALEDKDTTILKAPDGVVEVAAFAGRVPGNVLAEWGVKGVEDTTASDYYVHAWLVDNEIIKAQVSPFMRQPSGYYVGRYSPVPGSLIGESLPDSLGDIQDVANATLRALVNNEAIASGPLVTINDAAMAPGENDQLYPWKRFHTNVDPALQASGAKPVEFFQPNSNAQELLSIFQQLSIMADEVSAIPRYMAGSEKVGGAGRTASGLAMLMGNASKSLQAIAAMLDREVIRPAIMNTYDFKMLTDPKSFRGDEVIVVRGSSYVVKREQDRVRAIELLQATMNPIDSQLMGPQGRLKLLHAISQGLGIEGVVPNPDEAKPQPAGGPPPPIPPQQGSPPALANDRAPAEAVREPVEGVS